MSFLVCKNYYVNIININALTSVHTDEINQLKVGGFISQKKNQFSERSRYNMYFQKRFLSV